MAHTDHNKAVKDSLYKELELQLDLAIQGISVEAEEINKLSSDHANELLSANASSPLA